MELNKGFNYKGFNLLEIEQLEDIGSVGLIFEHEKTKGKLVKIVNDDDNKVFSIGFRTPPEDSTGVPHILEHSVLCGSRKFNTKEPFVELLKGSLNTFLNAMTYPDKTVYPVASKNEKDFFNLMDVYLDAVLYPNIYKCKEIFMQEGWHYAIDSKEAPLTYNGVVYNEMKGAYSSSESVLYRKIPSTIYPDTCYALSSGGDPEKIPDLTYEKFINFHKRYYHPSNAYMFLYGNGDTLKELEFINSNYLKDFKFSDIDSEIKIQKPFDNMVEEKFTYGISEGDSKEGKCYYSLNFVVGEAIDEENYLAFEVLAYLLLRSTSAPIKKALLAAGVGKAITGDFDSCIKQPTFSIIVKNANEGQEKEFKSIVMNTLRDLVKKGIDKELIEASINRVEFELREGDYGSYPKGLVYYLKIMDSWLYDGKPFTHLKYDVVLDKIKTALNTNYFEELIEKFILNNNHSSLVSLYPEEGLNEEKSKKLEDKLKKIKESFSDKEIDGIIEECKKLKERQNTIETEEELACIPALSLDDIASDVEKLPLEEKSIDDITVLHHDFHTNKIAYVNFLFKASAVPEELISYVSLLSDILGKCGTNKYDYSRLANIININTGGISYSPLTLSKAKEMGVFTPYLEVSFKCLENKMSSTLEILEEILMSTDLNDGKRIKQLIGERRAGLENSIFDKGHIIAAKKILSYSYNKGAYDEKIAGLQYYDFVCDLDDNFNEEIICNNLEKVRDLLFNKNNLIISYSGVLEDYTNFEKMVPKFIKSLNHNKVKYNEYLFDLTNKNEGLLTQGNVQYVAQGGNYKYNGYKYDGALSLLETIIGFDYLWNNVRVKGGAYGVFSNFRRDGGAYIVSYRDPNITETFNIYEKLPEYIKSFNGSTSEMTKYIIGTIRKLDHPLNNSVKGDLATSYYLTGITYEDLVREREEIIKSDEDKIRSFAPLVNDLLKQDYICVLGNENKIKENEKIFKKLIKVVK